jgi:hypothetical protein
MRNALRELDIVIERVRKEPNNHVMLVYLEQVRSEMIARVFRKPNSECGVSVASRMGSTIFYIMTAMMREAERLQFIAALLESVAQALGDLINGLHCLAEGLCQESKTLSVLPSVRHFRPTITLADRVHYFDKPTRDQQHANRRRW